MEHSDWKEKETGKGRGSQAGDLFVYVVTVMAPGQGLGRHENCQCLVSFGEVAFILLCSRLWWTKKNAHEIIYVARWVRKLISKRLNLGVPGKWWVCLSIIWCTQASVVCPSSLNSFHTTVNLCITIPSAKGIGCLPSMLPLRMFGLWSQCWRRTTGTASRDGQIS